MKIRLAILVILLPLLVFAQTNDFASTNAVAITNVPTSLPPGMEQVAKLFGPKVYAFVIKVAVFFGGIKLLLIPFAGWIERKIRDWLNRIAESKGNADEWLALLFSKTWYVVLAIVFEFFSITLPSTAELHRAIKLQNEAVVDAIDAAVPPTSKPDA